MSEEHTGCKFLDYDEEKYTNETCQLSCLSDGTKVWQCLTIDNRIRLVQFCKLRGRINDNDPTICTKPPGYCSFYEKINEVGVKEDV